MMQVLLADNHCFAVNKPAGLSAQAPPHANSAEAWVKAEIARLHAKPGRVYLGVPHRLDRPVSGVLLFARNSKSAARLAEQFRERAVEKVYWALLEASPTEREGVWEDYLHKLEGRARAEIVSAEFEGAKVARTCYRVLSETAAGTLVELRPETGRMHQLRVQAASRGCPIRGDATYGAKQPWADDAIALHARSLTFLHPLRYDAVTLTAEVPELWRVNSVMAD